MFTTSHGSIPANLPVFTLFLLQTEFIITGALSATSSYFPPTAGANIKQKRHAGSVVVKLCISSSDAANNTSPIPSPAAHSGGVTFRQGRGTTALNERITGPQPRAHTRACININTCAHGRAGTQMKAASLYRTTKY